MNCSTCGAVLSGKTSTREHPYQFKSSGLSNVWLAGVTLLICTNGHQWMEIVRLGELLDLLADILLKKDDGLTGEELRYLRKHAGLSGTEFAGRLQIDPSSLSRIEAGAQALGNSTDKLARAIVLAEMEREQRQELEELKNLLSKGRYRGKGRRESRLLTLKRGHWKQDKAA